MSQTDYDEDVPSFAPSQLECCPQGDTPKHNPTQSETQVGDTGFDVVEEVTLQPCDDTRRADTHEAPSELANEEFDKYQVPEICNATRGRPQRIQRAPVRMTYDVPGQPYYPVATADLQSALVAPNSVPAWFSVPPPYQTVWHWP